MEAHKKAPVPELAKIVPGIPQELSDLVARMMAKSPQDRPASMLEVVEALSKFARRKPIPFLFPEVVRKRRERAKERGIQTTLTGSMSSQRLSTARQSTTVGGGPTLVDPPRRKPNSSIFTVGKDSSGLRALPAIPAPSVPAENHLQLEFDNGDRQLVNRSEVLFGRAKDCTSRIDDPELALHHCKLVFDGQKWVMTTVGGVPMISNGESRRTTLPKIGDRIELSATTKFTIQRPKLHWPYWIWIMLATAGVAAMGTAIWWLLK
jgi:hypothetical protein